MAPFRSNPSTGPGFPFPPSSGIEGRTPAGHQEGEQPRTPGIETHCSWETFTIDSLLLPLTEAKYRSGYRKKPLLTAEDREEVSDLLVDILRLRNRMGDLVPQELTITTPQSVHDLFSSFRGCMASSL